MTRRHPPIQSIEDVIVFKLARFVGINERLGQRWSEALFDLSLNEWRMLALVQKRGPVRAGDLAELMLMDKSQLSRLIKSLSAKRLINPTADKGDARARMLRLTAKGLVLYKDVLAEVMRRNERVLEALSPEEAVQFDGMLNRLINHNPGRLEARQAED